MKKSTEKAEGKLDNILTVTTGRTADGKHTAVIQSYNGKPTLCIHKCDDAGWSRMDSSTFIAAIDEEHLKRALMYINEKRNMF